jgi:hypothetical protein
MLKTTFYKIIFFKTWLKKFWPSTKISPMMKTHQNLKKRENKAHKTNKILKKATLKTRQLSRLTKELSKDLKVDLR